MDTGESQHAGLFNESGVIDVDRNCKRCGYNLRGLSEDKACPECGTPVGLSIRGNLLRFADPNWVDKLARGLKIILWMILAMMLIMLLIQLGFARLGEILMLVVAAVSFYGTWLLTEPEPSIVGEDTHLTARRVVRIFLIIAIAGNVLQAIVQRTALGNSVGWSIIWLVVVTGLIGVVGEFARFVYYEQLAERIPDAAIARRARFLRWAYTISLVLTFSLAGIFSTGIAARGAGTAVLGCLASVAGIGVLVFSIMTLILLMRLRKTLAEQAKLARESWAAAGGDSH